MNKREYHLRRKYGITSEQYDDLLRRQNWCCAVCKRPAEAFKIKLAVDHDHNTGELRGLVCTHCNRYVIGRYRKENSIPLLMSLIKYLDRNYTGWFIPVRKKRKCKRRKKKH